MERIKAYFGLERNVLVMTVGRSLKAFGSGVFSEYVPKVLETLGASAPMIGTFGTINSGVSTLYNYLGGAVSDRLGRGKAMVLAALIAMVGYFIYAVSPLWWLFIPGSILLSASVHFDFMGSMALVGETVGIKSRAVSMASQAIIALPITLLAAPLGGALIGTLGTLRGFRIGVVIALGATAIGILFQRQLYRLPPPAASRISLDMRDAWGAMSRPLRSVLLANSVMMLGSGMSHLFLVLYAMNIGGVTALQYGLLHSVFLASKSVFSIPVGKISDRRTGLGRKPFVAMAFLLIAITPVLVVIAPSAAWFWPVFALRGIRETFDTVRKAMIIDLAGEGQRGRVLGFYYFVTGVVAFPASFIAGWLWQWSPVAPFLAGAAISAVGFVLFLFIRRNTEERAE